MGSGRTGSTGQTGIPDPQSRSDSPRTGALAGPLTDIESPSLAELKLVGVVATPVRHGVKLHNQRPPPMTLSTRWRGWKTTSRKRCQPFGTPAGHQNGRKKPGNEPSNRNEYDLSGWDRKELAERQGFEPWVQVLARTTV